MPASVDYAKRLSEIDCLLYLPNFPATLILDGRAFKINHAQQQLWWSAHVALDKANRINSDAAIEERKKAEPTQKTEKGCQSRPAKTEVATSGTTSWF